MLSKTSSADVTTAVSSAESLQTDREFLPEFPYDIGSFPSQDEEKDSKDQNASPEEKEAKKVSSHTPEIFDLVFGKDFQELIDLFRVPDQEKIIAVQKSLYQQQPTWPETGSRRLLTQEVDQVRSQLYSVQVQLFSAPIGGQCYVSA